MTTYTDQTDSTIYVSSGVTTQQFNTKKAAYAAERQRRKEMDKEQKIIIATQIRIAEDLYDYVNSEAERLGISMNAVMNNLMDDGRRFRQATVVIQLKAQ